MATSVYATNWEMQLRLGFSMILFPFFHFFPQHFCLASLLKDLWTLAQIINPKRIPKVYRKEIPFSKNLSAFM